MFRTRIGETCANPGAGDLTLGGAISSAYRTFAAGGVAIYAADDVSDVPVLIVQSASKWEACWGRRSAASTVQRSAEKFASSNAGAAVTFDGAVNVYAGVAFAEVLGPMLGRALSGGTGGSSTAYTLTLYPAMPIWRKGAFGLATFHTANTTTTPTLDVSGQGAKTLVDGSGNALAVGALATDSTHVWFYDGTDVRILTITGAATTSAAGAVELATSAETIAGSDTARAVTPAGLAAKTKKGTDIASAATITLPASGGYFEVTGAVNISAIAETAGSERQTGEVVILRFAAAPTVVYGATSIKTKDSANRMMAAGDHMALVKVSSTVWEEVFHQPKVSPTTDTGAFVKRSYVDTVTVASTVSVIPDDDTIPQSGEGAAFAALDLTHTPQATGNVLVVTLVVWLGSISGYNGLVALFKDADASALKAGRWQTYDTADGLGQVTVRHVMTAPSTTAIAFKMRYGTSNASHRAAINAKPTGGGETRFLGGAMMSFLQVEEFTP